MGVRVKQRVRGGPWWVFVNHGGKRKAKCVGDKKAAQALARELQQALAAGSLGLAEPAAEQGVTFAVYAEQYLDRAEGQLKHSTWKDYGSVCRVRLVPAFGDRPIADLRRRDVNDFEALMRGQGVGNANLAKILRVLSSILSEAVEDELLADNPALARRKRRRRTSAGSAGPRRPKPYTRDEIEKLLTTALAHSERRAGKPVHVFRPFHPLLLTLARTGLRLGEAIALKWGDIDWNGGFIHVQRACVMGKLDTPKSGKDRRVDMSNQLRETLRDLYRERFGRVVAIDATDQAERRGATLEQWVFPDQAGGVLDVHNLRRRVWAPLVAAAGLRHTRLHDLRHAYASILIEQGTEIQYVQQQLGHHSAAFTLSRYGHLLPRDRRGYVNQLDSATSRNPGATSRPEAAPADEPEATQPLAVQR